MTFPTLEDLMGVVLFIFGIVLMALGLLATVGLTDVIVGYTITCFIIFGFTLCVTGFVMARSVTEGGLSQFR